MTIQQICDLLQARPLTANVSMDAEVHSACGSDMMSDVLAYVKDQGVLVTGLNNPQVVRTASMMDMVCIVFVRGKIPGEEIIKLAEQLDITILATDLPMFPACGILYSNGLSGGVSGH